MKNVQFVQVKGEMAAGQSVWSSGPASASPRAPQLGQWMCREIMQGISLRKGRKGGGGLDRGRCRRWRRGDMRKIVSLRNFRKEKCYSP